MTPRFAAPDTRATPLRIVPRTGFDTWLDAQDEPVADWVRASGFTGAAGQVLRLPAPDLTIGRALLGWGDAKDRARTRFLAARAATELGTGTWVLEGDLTANETEEAALGWLLAGYAFDRYAGRPGPRAALRAPRGLDAARVEAIAAGEMLTRDLINTPASDMGPDELEAACRALAAAHGASIAVVAGDALHEANLPMIHAVGRASTRAPRLIDMTWGEDGPTVTLVGKGVCFDTGGLNLKGGASMGLMKKDMGGAATVLGLASMIMATGQALRLRVLIPAVENAVAGNAMRPGDVLTARNGLTVEVNNTDAEGRLVLADALALADEAPPDLMVCMATLTGAARTALGPDVAPYFTDDDALAMALNHAAHRVRDPLWRMPLHRPYETMIEPGIADLDNAPTGGHGGRDHRGAVPRPVRARHAALRASRRLRLEPHRRAGAAQGRRGDGRARDLRRAARHPRGGAGGRRGDVSGHDPRITPSNGHAAAHELRGIVEAARYVKGTLRSAQQPLVNLADAARGPRASQLLYGEAFRVIDERDGFAFGQSLRDGYCGWVLAGALGRHEAATHWVAAPATHLYHKPKLKAPPDVAIFFGSHVRVTAEADGFRKVSSGHFVPAGHLQPLRSRFTDPVAIADTFLGTPYLWGGSSRWGIDCSGLVQQALIACGIDCPRDSDQQRAVGRELHPSEPPARGDLVFWPGHVGLMADAETLLHANAHHMAVAYEPLAQAEARIAAAAQGDGTGHGAVEMRRRPGDDR